MNKVVSCLYSFFKKHFLDYWYDVFTNRVVKFWSDILRRPSLNFLVFQFANILWFCIAFSISHTVITDLPNYIKEPPTDISSISSFIFSILDSINTGFFIAFIGFISIPTIITLIEYLINKNKLSKSQLFNKTEFIINTIIYILFYLSLIYIFDDALSNGGGIYIAFCGPVITLFAISIALVLPCIILWGIEQVKNIRYNQTPYTKNTLKIYLSIPFAMVVYSLFLILLFISIYFYFMLLPKII